MTANNTKNGNAIASKALLAMHDPSFVDDPGDCQMFVREVVERCGVATYQRVMDAKRAGTALETMNNFAGTKYDVWNKVGIGGVPGPDLLLAGAILYKGDKTSGVNGHTGIVFHNLINGKIAICVAENSSYHVIHPGSGEGYGQGAGAKGWRTLALFGEVELVVYPWN